MSYKNVVILGGGPIGLLSAIEAKRYFKRVTIIEKRSGYSRTNVPVLGDDIRNHLVKVGLGPKTGLDKPNVNVSIGKMEEALWEQAQMLGVEMRRSAVVTDVEGYDVKRDGTYKRMRLELSAWDEGEKRVDDSVKPDEMECDLLIVCTGGGANTDELMVKLGFSWSVLQAKNYAAYAILSR